MDCVSGGYWTVDVEYGTARQKKRKTIEEVHGSNECRRLV